MNGDPLTAAAEAGQAAAKKAVKIIMEAGLSTNERAIIAHGLQRVNMEAVAVALLLSNGSAMAGMEAFYEAAIVLINDMRDRQRAALAAAKAAQEGQRDTVEPQK